MAAHGHPHDVTADADRRWLSVALAITAAITVAEVLAGLLAGSLALLSDAAHNLTDTASIALALVAARLAARPAAGGLTFGFKRAEILSAQVNGAGLLVLGVLIGVGAIGRLGDPPEIDATLVILVGVVGAFANIGAAWALSRARRRSLNVEGAMRHVLADLFGSVAAIVAGLAVLLLGFDLADPIAALVVVALMLHSAYRLLRDSGRILLEAAPQGVDVNAIGTAMVGLREVTEVHDLHVWEVTSGFPALSAHVLVPRDEDCHAARRELEAMLRERFEIEHTTLQVDHEHGRLLQLGPRERRPEEP
ncbi:MAG: cation diffusion facilitator family transporter [Thermoleophilaceae bacterium]